MNFLARCKLIGDRSKDFGILVGVGDTPRVPPARMLLVVSAVLVIGIAMGASLVSIR